MPRYLFNHRKRRRQALLELSGDVLHSADAATGEPLVPTQTRFASASEAKRAHDQKVSALLAEGFVLEAFDAPESPLEKTRRPTRAKALMANPELERRLASDPTNEAHWKVYEDWLLEQGDPRGDIITQERARSIPGAAEARGKIEKLLLGPHGPTVAKRLTRPVWRAGYLLRCGYEAEGAKGRQLFEEFVAAPAVRLIQSLDLHGDFGLVAQVGGLTSLRQFSVSPEFYGYHRIDASQLAPLSSLEELRLDGCSEVAYAPNLARLRSLRLTPTPEFALEELFTHPFDALESLWLNLHNRAEWSVAASLTLNTPKLAALELITEAPRALAIVEKVAASGLATRLSSFKLLAYEKSRVLGEDEKRTWQGGAFATVGHVEVAESLFKNRPR